MSSVFPLFKHSVLKYIFNVNKVTRVIPLSGVCDTYVSRKFLFWLEFSINKINIFNDGLTIARNYSRCTWSIPRYTVAVSLLFRYNVTTMVVTDVELFFGDAKREVHTKKIYI